MKDFKSILLGIFLLLIFVACGNSKTTSKTHSTPNQANVATQASTNTSKTPVEKESSIPKSIANEVIVYGKEVTTKSGGDFCIDVQVVNFVDVISMQYSTNWDTKAIQYKGVQNFVLKDLTKDNFGRANGEESTLRLSWYAQDLKGASLFDGATIYQACFKAIGKSGTTTEIDFADKPMISEIANSKMQTMKTDLKSVKVIIE